MKVVAGVFSSSKKAQDAFQALRSSGVPKNKIALLHQNEENNGSEIPVTAAEQPGIGKAIVGSIGAATGMAAGWEVGTFLAALIPGVGPIVVTGYLATALLGLGGAALGFTAGEKLDDAMGEGLPEDELYIYKGALRSGRCVLFAIAKNEQSAVPIRALMKERGAETIDAARDKWWLGLRDIEEEHYTGSRRDFDEDEVFYRLGFEAALHSRFRGAEYDQVLSEMNEKLEILKAQCPGADVEEGFRRGYERGAAYDKASRPRATMPE